LMHDNEVQLVFRELVIVAFQTALEGEKVV
jgi:hypothetical protein